MLFDLARLSVRDATDGSPRLREAEREDVRAPRARDDTLVFQSEEKQFRGEKWESVTLKSDRSVKVLGLQSMGSPSKQCFLRKRKEEHKRNRQ